MSSNQIETVGTVDSFVFGRFQLKVSENGNTTLFTEGHPVALSTVAITVLRVLLENHGSYVRTRELLASASQSPDATENMIHGAVHELRRTLNDAALIKTERLKGYCFTGEILEPGVAAHVIVDPKVTPEVPSDEGRDPFVIVALLVSAAVLLLPFGLAFASGSWANVSNQLGFIQALMILVALGYDFYLSDSRKHAEDQTAFIATQQFRRSWRLLLASWCGLYFALLLSLRFAPAPGEAPSWQWQALQVLNTSLNNASIFALVLCYVVLNRPTVVAVAGREVEEDLPFKRGLILVGVLGLLEVLLVVLLENRGHADYAGAVLFGSDVLSGVAGGIAMALFVSRLDSRLLSTSGLLPIIPIVLYFYAVIQPFYPLLNWTFPGRGLPPHVDLWIMQLAFILKSVMYIYVTDRFKKGRFLFYMTNARRFYEDVENKWSRF